MKKTTNQLTLYIALLVLAFVGQSCGQKRTEETKVVEKEVRVAAEKPEYFQFTP